jgi:hypothetical protein
LLREQERRRLVSQIEATTSKQPARAGQKRSYAESDDEDDNYEDAVVDSDGGLDADEDEDAGFRRVSKSSSKGGKAVRFRARSRSAPSARKPRSPSASAEGRPAKEKAPHAPATERGLLAPKAEALRIVLEARREGVYM